MGSTQKCRNLLTKRDKEKQNVFFLCIKTKGSRVPPWRPLRTTSGTCTTVWEPLVYRKWWPTNNRLFMPIAQSCRYFFYANNSAILGSFMISFFSWETLHSAVLSWTNKLRLCFCWSQGFGQDGCYFGCDETVYLQLCPYTTFFATPQLRVSWLTR